MPPPSSSRHRLFAFVLILLQLTTFACLINPVSAKSLGPLQSCIELVPTRSGSLVFGVIHTCGPKRRLKLWGTNYGGLGADNKIQIGGVGKVALDNTLAFVKGMSSHTVIAACAGVYHTCVLLGTNVGDVSGGVKCFGDNSKGQLGLGDNVRRGDGVVGTMDTLPFVNIGGGKATAIECGPQYTCVIMELTKRIKCWGANSNGELGVNKVAGVGLTSASMGTALADVKINLDFKSVKPGTSNCGLTTTGKVYCWGSNDYGQLGQASIVTPIGNALGSMATLIPVNLGLTGSEYVEDIYAGTMIACALIAGGPLRGVKCWGRGSFGSLGYESITDKGASTSTLGNNLPFVNLAGRNVSKLAVGSFHVCALFEIGTAACWGDGEWGQRGVDSTIDAGSLVNTMGTFLKDVKMAWGPIHDLVVADQATMVVAGQYRQLFTFGSNAAGLMGGTFASRTGTLLNEMSRLKALDIGLCLVSNFMEMGEDIWVTSATVGLLSTNYWIKNPLNATVVVVRVTGPAFLTSVDFNVDIVLNPGQKRVFNLKMALNHGALHANSVSASYYCVGDPDVSYPLPEIRVQYGGSPPVDNTTSAPIISPTRTPTMPITTSPTNKSPTKRPTTASPTRTPRTRFPTRTPTMKPTRWPTRNPTALPSRRPTTKRPSFSPTQRPSKRPITSLPSKRPRTSMPSKRPTTTRPSRAPTSIA